MTSRSKSALLSFVGCPYLYDWNTYLQGITVAMNDDNMYIWNCTIKASVSLILTIAVTYRGLTWVHAQVRQSL